MHEHVRPDRDEYVDLNYEKITKEPKENKEQRNKDIIENLDIKRTEAVTLSPYDYVSVMHYGWKWIRKVKKEGAVIFDPANNFGLSELDIKHLNELYNCSKNDENKS